MTRSPRILCLFLILAAPAFAASPAFETLPLGSVRPKGWIHTQLTNDAVSGMAGNFIALRPRYGSVSWVKKDGNPGAGEMGGNWIDGFTRMAFLVDVPEAKAKVEAFVKDVLGAREADGYLGNIPADKRFQHRLTGELWSESRLYMGLLAYYEFTRDKAVLEAVVKAVHLTLSKYGQNNSPFHYAAGDREQKKSGHGPQTHGLMFVDVLEWLHRLTGERAWVEAAHFLYQDYSTSPDVDQQDTQLRAVLDPSIPYFFHAVQVAEHLRVPLFLAYADGREPYPKAARGALEKLQRYLVISGSLASDESVYDHIPLPAQAYEYCTTTELSVSLADALQKTGETRWGDRVERDVFNAAQGARFPDGKAIAYLSSSTLPAAREEHDLPHSGKKRHKYSPAHDVGGACCSANAVKILPYYVGNMWMRSTDGLAALLYGPSVVRTTVAGAQVEIEEETAYPFSDEITFAVKTDKPVAFTLSIRVPTWTKRIRIDGAPPEPGRMPGLASIRKNWKGGERVRVVFENPIQTNQQGNGDFALTRGALVYALPWGSTLVPLDSQKFTLTNFKEYDVVPRPAYDWSGQWIDLTAPGFGFSVHTNEKGSLLTPWSAPPLALRGFLRNPKRIGDFKKSVLLLPMGCTLLRFASFPPWPFPEGFLRDAE